MEVKRLCLLKIIGVQISLTHIFINNLVNNNKVVQLTQNILFCLS